MNLNSMRSMWLYVVSLALLSFALASCGSSSLDKQQREAQLSQQLTQAVLWHQNAGEREALCHQAFNLATLRVDQYLSNDDKKENPIVIVDIDETIVDNSPFQAQAVKSDFMYPNYWHEWVETASAEALPGAVDFLNYASDNGIGVYYISNRSEKNREATLKNLKNLGFPKVEDEKLFLKKKHAVKDSLRKELSANNEIVLLIGDNLDDFSNVFKHQSVDKRLGAVDSLKALFGDKFIVTPNAMYGDWEGAIYSFEYAKSQEEKNKIRKAHLKGFDVGQ